MTVELCLLKFPPPHISEPFSQEPRTEAQVLHFLYMSLLHYIKTILLGILGASQRLETNTNIASFVLKVITGIISRFLLDILILFLKFTSPPRAFCFYRLVLHRDKSYNSRLKCSK